MRTFALLWLIACSIGFAASAAPPMEGAEPDGAAAESDSRELESRKDELLGLLAQVDERYGDVSATLKEIESRIVKTNENLAKLRKEINSYQSEVNRLENELAGQVRAAYAMGQKDRLKLLFNQQDPALSSRIMLYYQYFNKRRLEKLANYRQTVSYLDQLDKDKQLETDQLAKQLAQKKSEQSALEAVKKQRNELVARLNVNSASKQEQLSFLQESENKLINLIRTLEHDESAVSEQEESQGTGESGPGNGAFPKLQGDFPSLKGKLPLPVRGKLSGMLENSPNSDTMWKGVLINAQEGAEIRAVTAGKVAYSGALKGYGLLLILEHDKNFMTLYAFNQSLLKHKGDKVEAGEVIATVGQSGGRNKPGLYFEIRQQGKPVDPLLWCRN